MCVCPHVDCSSADLQSTVTAALHHVTLSFIMFTETDVHALTNRHAPLCVCVRNRPRQDSVYLQLEQAALRVLRYGGTETLTLTACRSKVTRGCN